MPRASWNGFLRLSLVTSPVYLAPATTESKRIRFHQLNPETGNRLRQQLVDEETGEVIGRDRIVRGYEHTRGRYITVDEEELKALQIESSKIIDLTQFVGRDEVDPVFLDTPYYVYPDGELAVEAFQVIGEAMAAKGLVGIGRVTIAGRERMVLVEPHEGGLLMFTMRSSEEVRKAEFAKKAEAKVDPEMVAVAETIIERRRAKFDPAAFRDHYQDALRELVDNKLSGVVPVQHEVAEPAKVINLMDALKRSLAADGGAAEAKPASKSRRAKAAPDRRQPAMLLPVAGGRKKKEEPAGTEQAAASAPRRRRKA
jgi:DNA end-binding protein Ku